MVKEAMEATSELQRIYNLILAMVALPAVGVITKQDLAVVKVGKEVISKLNVLLF